MKTFQTRRRWVACAVALSVAASVALTSCASNDASSSGESGGAAGNSPLPKELVDAAVAKAKAIAGQEKLGDSLSIVGIAGGEEGGSLEQAMAPFTTATGTKIKYTGTGDQAKVVQSAVEGGNLPDLVDGQGAGQMLEYAKQGKLLPLNDVVGDELNNYNKGLTDFASVGGKVYGLWGETDSFAIWYDPQTYKGPKDPASWAELQSWVDDNPSAGSAPAPWCMTLEAGTRTGFPAQAITENIFLKMWGPEKMKQWASGELSWTSPEVKAAFERFGQIVKSDKTVNGGPSAVVSTSFANFADGMYTKPQQCQLSLWGNYIGGLIKANNPSVSSPETLDFFNVPGDTPEAKSAENTTGHLMYAFKDKDNPTTRAFLKYWASSEAQSLIAASGRWTVANSKVPSSAYPNPALRKSAQQLQDAKVLSPGPATTANSATIAAWNTAVVNYIQDPETLDKGLANVQATIK
ncbi:hypothetical protein [Paenarthrobacter sp. NPDC089316]|uniref:ABC transporter substrate-binding protein n=1 Tax=unclassified Paenarthrobacter TaxID=2634190 RepID=UPI00341EE404